MNRKMNIGGTIIKTASRQKAVVTILALAIAMLFMQPSFFRVANLLQILNTVSIYEILAAGVTMVLIAGACDLSIGGMLGLSGIVTVNLINAGMPIVLAILCAIALGALVGFINGFFVVHQKTEPFIITLGMGMVLKGISQIVTDAHPVSAKNPKFMEIANGKLFGVIPNLIILMIIVLLAVYFVLRYTQFGRNIYAVGGDYEIAVYGGVNARWTKWGVLILSGAIAALGGALNSSLLNTGNSIYGDTAPLLVHCGAVIGGTSLIGGIGGIPQTFVGLLSLTVLQNCMNALSISPYVQLLIQGFVIVLILWMDLFGIKRKVEAV